MVTLALGFLACALGATNRLRAAMASTVVNTRRAICRVKPGKVLAVTRCTPVPGVTVRRATHRRSNYPFWAMPGSASGHWLIHSGMGQRAVNFAGRHELPGHAPSLKTCTRYVRKPFGARDHSHSRVGHRIKTTLSLESAVSHADNLRHKWPFWVGTGSLWLLQLETKNGYKSKASSGPIICYCLVLMRSKFPGPKTTHGFSIREGASDSGRVDHLHDFVLACLCG